jgi:hypothetical protein
MNTSGVVSEYLLLDSCVQRIRFKPQNKRPRNGDSWHLRGVEVFLVRAARVGAKLA